MGDTNTTKPPLSTTVLARKLSPFDADTSTLNLIWDEEKFFAELRAQTLLANQKQQIKKFTDNS